jgi:hypothetical protein
VITAARLRIRDNAESFSHEKPQKSHALAQPIPSQQLTTQLQRHGFGLGFEFIFFTPPKNTHNVHIFAQLEAIGRAPRSPGLAKANVESQDGGLLQSAAAR